MNQTEIYAIESIAKEIVNFGNEYIRKHLLSLLNSKIDKSNYLDVPFGAGQHFYFLYYSEQSGKIYLSLEKYEKIFSYIKNKYEYENVLALLLFREITHHLQGLVKKKVESLNDEWKMATADYLAGHLLYHYLKFKKISTITRPLYLYKIPFFNLVSQFGIEPDIIDPKNIAEYNKKRAASIEFGFNEAKDFKNIKDFFRKLW